MNIYTPPDCDLHSNVPKIWIYNCAWTDEQIIEAFSAIPDDKEFDVYIYDDTKNDYIWEEGMKHRCVKRYNYKDYSSLTHLEMAQRIYDEF